MKKKNFLGFVPHYACRVLRQHHSVEQSRNGFQISRHAQKKKKKKTSPRFQGAKGHIIDGRISQQGLQADVPTATLQYIAVQQRSIQLQIARIRCFSRILRKTYAFSLCENSALKNCSAPAANPCISSIGPPLSSTSWRPGWSFLSWRSTDLLLLHGYVNGALHNISPIGLAPNRAGATY